MRHFLSVADIGDLGLPRFFNRIQTYKRGDAPKFVEQKSFSNKRVATLFFEPSTGTRASFEAAAHMLGARIISFPSAAQESSAAKGEALEDTIRRISGYVDVIVLRHPEAGAAKQAAKVSRVPVINAGDGGNEHPTQALSDLFTIWEACESGTLERKVLRVHFYGDNLGARTVHSLALALGMYAPELGMRIERMFFGGPYKELALPKSDFLRALMGMSAPLVVSNSGLGTPAHVVYLTRVQKERYEPEQTFTREEPDGSKEARHWALTFDKSHAVVMDRSSLIMHPFPRGLELSRQVDADPRAHYDEQSLNKLPVAAALLERILSE